MNDFSKCEDAGGFFGLDCWRGFRGSAGGMNQGTGKGACGGQEDGNGTKPAVALNYR